jgi:hypothetical protein
MQKKGMYSFRNIEIKMGRDDLTMAILTILTIDFSNKSEKNLKNKKSL